MTSHSDEYRTMKLGDFISLRRGHDLPEHARKQGDVPVVSSSGVTGWHNEAISNGPGVVTGRYGTLGELHFVDVPYWPLNTTLYVNDFKGQYPRFVYYFLKTIDFAQYNGAGAVPGINRNVLNCIDVRIPGRDQQRAIADRLTAYDDLIETNRRRIALLEESARLLYREWFVKLRFPGHERVEKVDGVPEGWSEFVLSDLAQVNRDSINTREKYEHIRYIDIASVETGVIKTATKMPFPEAPGRARRKVQHGDVIWSCVRPNRKSYGLIWEPSEDMIVSTGFAVLSAMTVPFTYLYLTTTTDVFIGYLTNRATGAAYPAVTAKDFEAAPLLKPADSVLREFHEMVEPLFAMQENLKAQNQALAQARDALLPKLMSGQLNL